MTISYHNIMRYIEDKAPLLEYVLVDWSQPSKAWHEKKNIHVLTEAEANWKNNAYAMNQTSIRLVKKTNYWELKQTHTSNERTDNA